MSDRSSSGGANYVTPREGLGTEALPATFNSRLGNVEDLSQNILTLVVVSLIGVVVALVIGVCVLTLDQLHFNNQIYRDGYNPPKVTKYVQVPPQKINLKPSTIN